MKPQQVPFSRSSQAAPAWRQQRFAYVEFVVELPNVSSTDAHVMPGVGIAQHESGAVEPGTHASLFARVHAAPEQTPPLQVPPLQEVPHVLQFSGSVATFTQVFVAAQKSGVAVGHAHVVLLRHT
jgi:hypothetical protein